VNHDRDPTIVALIIATAIGNFPHMKTHEDIDQRSLELARSVVAHIDADPERKGLLKARVNCEHWSGTQSTPVLREWQALLARDWPMIRAVLLDEGQEGRRLRQSNPFCGILSTRERWEIYRRFHHEPKAA
jgi:hypothetical protein